MNYEQLLYVTELANHHTLQATADFLHISKSGLSQSIAQLEDELGAQIFARSHQGITLTDKGQELLPYIKSMMAAKVNLVHQASRLVKLNKRHAHAKTGGELDDHRAGSPPRTGCGIYRHRQQAPGRPAGVTVYQGSRRPH